MNLSGPGMPPGTEHMIERQMLLWQARLKAAREEAATEKHVDPKPAAVYRFVTICRNDGTLGDEVARELANRTGWHVFDKEIVNYIAENGRVRESLVRQLDERSQGLIHDGILRLLRMPEWKSFGSDEYHEALLKTLAYLSTQGHAILVGRGANFALRNEEHGLHVRTIASLEVRAKRLSDSWGVSPDAARRCMLAGDEERKHFVRHHFKQDVDDLNFYDLVINTDYLTAEQAAGSIQAILKARNAARGLSAAGS